MAASGWDSTDLLSRWNTYAGRPTTADAMGNPTKYQFLADAQQYVIDRIASIKPSVLYGAPTALTTADGGYTFTFGVDGNGYALFPMGKAGIFPSLQAIPNAPWQPGVDYLDEGTQIRMPNGRQWSGTLYWYGITPAQQMSAAIQPVLNPPPIRALIVLKAVADYARSAGRNSDMALTYEAQFEREFGPWMTQLRRHFRGGGAMGPLLQPLFPTSGF